MKKHLFSLFLLVVCMLSFPVHGQDTEPIRTWKDGSGTFSIQATFVKMTSRGVVLRRGNNKEITIPVSKLSVADQEYLKLREEERKRFQSAKKVASSDELRKAIESAKDDAVILLGEGIYTVLPQKPYEQGFFIENKKGLIISGAGSDKTTIKLASDVDVGFLIGNNVEDLKIENLHIEGTPPLKTNSAGIGTTSTATDVKNVALTDLRIDHVAIGIFLATNEGTVRDVKITNNIVSNTVGTDAGWGYGIHTRKIGNVLIAHNFIENATRHSIYVRESPANSTLFIEDNFILNHDLQGLNPRWYCAALNSPDNHSTMRISNNFFINSNAVGIAVMTNADDLVMMNNQIIGEHYVGIWPVTGQPHTALANSIVLHPNPENPQWSHKVSSFDWANGKETDSKLETPNARWQEPDFVCHLGGKLFVMKAGTLDKVTPYTWEFETAAETWGDVNGMCAVEGVGDQGNGLIYVITGKGIFLIDPDKLESSLQVGDWSGAEFAAATTSRLHILKEGALHSINLETFEVEKSEKDWSAVQWMYAWGNKLYVFDGQAHHRIDPNTLDSEVVSRKTSK